MPPFRARQLITPRMGCKLRNFTAFKTYQVLYGEGEANQCEKSAMVGFTKHSKRTCNVLDDQGKMVYVTANDFVHFESRFGMNWR